MSGPRILRIKTKKIVDVYGKRWYNQDEDNIFDLEKNLTYLGLSEYTYNLTKNLREIVKPEATIEDIDITDVQETILSDIFELPKTLQKRINGFKISNIFEYLAILKRKYPDIRFPCYGGRFYWFLITRHFESLYFSGLDMLTDDFMEEGRPEEIVNKRIECPACQIIIKA